MSSPAPILPADWNQPTAYERWYYSSLGRAYAASLERILRPWLAQVAGGLVLDLGCGPGLLLDRVFPAQAEVIGLDCSREMVERAKIRSQAEGHSRRFIVGTVENLPFAAEMFDVLFCVNCLEFVKDRGVAFQEIARVLRPGGTAIVGVLNRRSIWELARRMRRPFSQASYYRGRFFRVQELRDHCARVGLDIEEIKTAVHFPPWAPGPLAGVFDRLDRWWQDLSLGGGGVILCRASKRE